VAHYTTTILRLRIGAHDSRGIETVNFTTAAALSAGKLMASAGTPYRLVPAHFYRCPYSITERRIAELGPYSLLGVRQFFGARQS